MAGTTKVVTTSFITIVRVGLIIYGSLQTVSGGYLYDRKLVERLRKQGDHVEIFAQTWRSYPRRLSDNLSASFLRDLRQAPLDLLLQDELNHPSLFWLNRRLRPTVRYPIVSIVHHLRSHEARPTWQNRLYALAERSYLASVDGFVCNSAATLRDVAGLAESSPPAVVAPPAGDRWPVSLAEAQIEARASAPGPLRIIFVGNLTPRKGLHTLLSALAHLPAGAATLTVVGSPGVDPAYAAACRRQAGQAKLGDSVTFCGSLTDAELAAELSNHQVLAAPSSYEGFGIVYLEGMGFGLPAIATTAGGASEIVSDGENGFLLKPGDAGALAATLRRLSADRALLARLSLAARRRFEAHPTWDETTAAIHRFLNGLLQYNR